MAKILEIKENVISIGTDDGSIKEVRASDLNFVPHIGDKIEIFETETKTIISKIEEINNTGYQMPPGGININMNNNQNVQQPGNVYVPGNATKAVSKVAYCLLCLFLGGIGVHKFYAGKTGQGLLYLFFCWTFVPSLIAVVDLIIALTKPADSNGMILV